MLNPYTRDILNHCLKGEIPTFEEVIYLLQLDEDSADYYALCGTANKLAREHFDNKGDVCAQIGLDYAPCPHNCGFCAFNKNAGILEERIYWEPAKVATAAREMVKAGANAVYLMTTGNYPMKRLIEIGKLVRETIPPEIPLVANTRDFSFDQGLQMKKAGFTAVYHALRLREGQDTAIPVQQRLDTINNAQKAGLAVQVCLEPVGPEHTAEEIANQMFWARETCVTFNGAMSRTAVTGTPLAKHGEISFRKLAKIVAVCRLVMGDRVKAHCTHEPNLPSLLAGANLLWAEAGPNPRDLAADTSRGRGQSVAKCQAILKHAGFELRKGASPACYI